MIFTSGSFFTLIKILNLINEVGLFLHSFYIFQSKVLLCCAHKEAIHMT